MLCFLILQKFLKYNILFKFQFGFRQETGTNNALAYVSKCVYKSLDDSKSTIAVFLDLAMGFDLVNHKLLLKK